MAKPWCPKEEKGKAVVPLIMSKAQKKRGAEVDTSNTQ